MKLLKQALLDSESCTQKEDKLSFGKGQEVKLLVGHATKRQIMA